MSKRRGIRGIATAVGVMVLVGCSGTQPGDSGTPDVVPGADAQDTGTTPLDARDSASPGMDVQDSGTPPMDASDGGSTGMDAPGDTVTPTDVGNDAATPADAQDSATAPTDAADTVVPPADAADGAAPAPEFCDVVYAIGAGTCGSPTRTGRFHTIKTGLGASNAYYDVGTNCSLPRRGMGAGTSVASPFTPTEFPRGYIRLRFPSSGGAPAAGAVQVIEYYLPLEFTVSTAGTEVATDIDHSAGLLRYANTGCPTGVTGCVTGVSDTTAPVLDRRCAPVATGTLSGTSLTWGTCMVATPPPCTGTSCTPSSAQLTWAEDDAQDTMMGPGCLTNVNSWGGVYCASGLCGFVPGTSTPSNLTWDQSLPTMTFSSTSYGAPGTTVTLSEFTIPNAPNDVYSATEVVTATAVHTECGVVTALTCDEE